MKRQIVNIINFIRGIEPREGRNIDLYEPVIKQVDILNSRKLKGTFLLQYDALKDSRFYEILGKADKNLTAFGLWFEIVQEMAEKASIEWEGRYPWDWHAQFGFTPGYAPEVREKLIDIAMEEFKFVFGYFPRVIGSWTMDAHTLAYIEKKYDIAAVCVCRDQWGTDGYNLWGGYYSQGYYPSKNNYFCPANSIDAQINIPVFRMLGSDPIYQYDLGLSLDSGAVPLQQVVTLEPICHENGGGSPEWVDWFIKENYSGRCMSFGYTQAGQENSFGWPKMKDGIEYQFEIFEKKQNSGQLEVELLEETGNWYKKKYSLTPASVVTAFTDYKNEGNKTVWYNSRFYRCNILIHKNHFWFRDIHKFCDQYKERYFDEICQGNNLYFDNLPVIDGNHWSGHGIRAGLFPVDNNGYDVEFEKFQYFENETHACIIFSFKKYGELRIEFHESHIFMKASDSNNIRLEFRFDELSDRLPKVVKQTTKTLKMNYNNYTYSSLNLHEGFLNDRYIVFEEGQLVLNFSN